MPTYPYKNPLVQVDLKQPDSETRMVLNHQTSKYVRLGHREYSWLITLDGQTSRDDIPSRLGIDGSLAEEFLKRLEAAKLVLVSDTPVLLAQPTRTQNVSPPARVIEWAQFGQLRIRLVHTDKALYFISKLSILRNRSFIALLSCFSLLGVVGSVRLLQQSNLNVILQGLLQHRLQLILLMVLIFITTVFHELGHAIVCKLAGVPVRSMGVMLYYLQPAAYVDVTDSWQLTNKWHRVAISAAGVYVQAIFNAFAVAVILLLRPTGWCHDVMLLYVALNLFTIAFNLVPLVKLDGYWILSAIVAVPNLRDRAREWWNVLVHSTITRKAIDPKALRFNAVLSMTPLGRSLLACYGLSANVFGIAMWMGGLSFAFRIARWFGLSQVRSLFFVAAALMFAAGAFFFIILRNRRNLSPAATPIPVPAQAPITREIIDPTRTLQLNPFAAVVEEEERLTFAWTSANQISIQNVPQLMDLLPHLRGGISLNEITQLQGTLDSQLGQALQRLFDAKHLRYAGAWDIQKDEERYSRQIGWLSFNSFSCGSERAVLEKLRRKSIAILGVGGVGSSVALSLAACGIGELHLADGDNIEITNLNRQLLYTPADIGRPKIDVAAEKLLAFNPALRVRKTNAFLNSVQDVMRAIEGADFVIRSLDTPVEAQFWVNEACVQMGIPCTGAGFLAQGAIIGPTVIPGETACLSCNQPSTLPRLDRGIGPTIAPIVTIIGGILANEAITYLGGLGSVQTCKAMMLIEAPTLRTHLREVNRNVNCPVCGVNKAGTA